jgi:hypothetical protein
MRGAAMGPFDVKSDWFEKYWYSAEPPKPIWRVPTALVGIVVGVILGLFT